MPASCWRDWAAAAESAFDGLRAERGPVVVIGFSVGGTLALYLATRRPVERLVLLAPFWKIRYADFLPLRPVSYIGRLAKLLPNVRRRPPAVRDPETRQWASASDPFRTFSLHAAESALELVEEVKPLVPAISVAVLIIQGKLDTVADPRGSKWLHHNLGSTEKTIATLPRSDHLVALDRDRDEVIALTKAFILVEAKKSFLSKICGCVLARGGNRGCAKEPVLRPPPSENHTTFS
jgi:carboxylesterase